MNCLTLTVCRYLNTTVEEIKSMVEVGKEQGIINSNEKDMIDAVINFDEKTAEEIMTARTEVFAIRWRCFGMCCM